MKVQSILKTCTIICSLCILLLFPIIYIIGNIEHKEVVIPSQSYVKIKKVSKPLLMKYYISVNYFYNQGKKYRWGYVDIFTMNKNDFIRLNQHETFGYNHHKIQVYEEEKLSFYKPEDLYIVVKNDNLLFTTQLRYNVIYIDLYISIATVCLAFILFVLNCIIYRFLNRKFPNQRIYELTPDRSMNNI